MRETLHGRAQLRSLAAPPATYEVDYEIHFDTQLRTVRAGMPPVPKVTATVTRMQATDGGSYRQVITNWLPKGSFFDCKIWVPRGM